MDELSPQERAVYELIAANPFVAQGEIAQTLGLARSTVAAHVVNLVRKGCILGRGYVLPRPRRIACIGAAAIDRKYHVAGTLLPGTSNPASGGRSFGGVARNVVETLARLGVATSFVTILGADEAGRDIIRHLGDLGVDTSQVVTMGGRATADYVAILDPAKDLAFGIADMAIFESFDLAHLNRAWPHLASADWIFADCNLPAPVLAGVVERARAGRASLAVNAVSAPKAARLPADLAGIELLFANRDEAAAILGVTAAPEVMAERLRARGAARVVLTIGAEGALVLDGDHPPRHVAAWQAVPRDVTGAGDALVAGMLYRLLSGAATLDAARTGTLLAALTVESEATVLPELTSALLEQAAAGRMIMEC